MRKRIVAVLAALLMATAVPAVALTWQNMETDFEACAGGKTVHSTIYAEAERRHRFSAGSWRIVAIDLGYWFATTHDSGWAGVQWYNDVEAGDGYSFAGSCGFCG